MTETVLFDLDGTLANTERGIFNGINYALSSFGISVTDTKTLYAFIGPPLEDAFRSVTGLSPEQAKRAVEQYRVYYRAGGVLECALYEGIAELLRELKQRGITVIMATAKPEVFARQIAEHFDIARYFDEICGATLDGVRKEKNDVLAYVLQKTAINPASAVMVGDRMYDVLGGKKFGMKTVGVTYGFGKKEELCSCRADKIVDTVAELRAYLCEG